MQSAPERLEKLRIKRNWTWDQVAEALDLSVSMLMMVKRGARSLSPKARNRLDQAEAEAGLNVQSETYPQGSYSRGSEIRELPDSNLVDDVLAQMKRVREEMQALDVAFDRLQAERRRPPAVSSKPASEAEQILDAADEEDRRRHPGSQH